MNNRVAINWSEEEEDHLAKFWNEGYSYSAIVDAMQQRFGYQYSRSCIAGKRKRLKLPKRTTRFAGSTSRSRPATRPHKIRKTNDLSRNLSFSRHPRRTEIQDQIFEMRERGDTIRKIAETLGFPVRTIYWHCAINGIYPDGQPPERYKLRFQTTRNGRIVRAVTKEDEDEFVRLRLEGYTTPQIGEMTGRSSATVRFRLAVRAAREEYDLSNG